MITGFAIGHYTDVAHATGCTVILCPREGAIAGVDVRGPAPATRETDLLRPGHLVERANAVLFTGGSAFGLDAAGGVMRFLEEKGIGFETPAAHVPIVPAAAIFDLAIGSANVRPDTAAGYQACLAVTTGAVPEGTVGAGTGATVGHVLGPQGATKSGLGMASREIAQGILVDAIVVVNAFGDVVDPRTGAIIAGARQPHGTDDQTQPASDLSSANRQIQVWLDTADALQRGLAPGSFMPSHTTIGAIMTNAALTKEQANLIAMMAHVGLARALRPAHSLFDGDALFVLSAGIQTCDLTTLGHAASEVVAEAILRAVNTATGLHGIPARREIAE